MSTRPDRPGGKTTPRRRAAGPILAGVLGCLIFVRAEAAGLRDFGDGWVFSPREFATFLSGVATPPGADAMMRPAGPWAAAGRTRLFGLPDLTLDFLAVGTGTDAAAPAVAAAAAGGRPLQVSGTWQRTHGGLLQEDQVQASLTLGRNPEVRLRAQWWSAAISGQRIGRVRSAAAVVGGVIPVGAGWLARQEIHLPLWDDGPGPRPRRCRQARTVLWGDGGGLALAWDRSRDGSFQVGLEVLVKGTPNLGLLLRSDPSTGCLGPGVAVRRGSLMVLSSHVQHPDLGLTHRIVLVVGQRPGEPW